MCLQNLFRDRMAEVHGPIGILAQGGYIILLLWIQSFVCGPSGNPGQS
jgi:hypothetical protein